MRPQTTALEKIKERWEKFNRVYGKPGRTFTYECFALKMRLSVREAREVVNWSVGQELARSVSRGLFEILPPPKPLIDPSMPNHVCGKCGKEFFSSVAKKYCSGACADAVRGVTAVICKNPACKAEFKTKARGKVFCSAKCRAVGSKILRIEASNEHSGTSGASLLPSS